MCLPVNIQYVRNQLALRFLFEYDLLTDFWSKTIHNPQDDFVGVVYMLYISKHPWIFCSQQ